MQRQDDLRLRIAEPDVELDHLRPVGGEHQTDVEEPDVRIAVGAHPIEHRRDDPVA